MRQDVPLDIDPRRDLDQFKASSDELEHAALGHVIDRLLRFCANLPEKVICSTALTNFLLLPSLQNVHLAVFDLDAQPASGEGAGVNDECARSG